MIWIPKDIWYEILNYITEPEYTYQIENNVPDEIEGNGYYHNESKLSICNRIKLVLQIDIFSNSRIIVFNKLVLESLLNFKKLSKHYCIIYMDIKRNQTILKYLDYDQYVIITPGVKFYLNQHNAHKLIDTLIKYYN